MFLGVEGILNESTTLTGSLSENLIFSDKVAAAKDESFLSGSNCGGNCPGGNCASCLCRTTQNVQDITYWCSQYSGWNQANCRCIMSHESGGNANAVNQNVGGLYDVGLWQINDFNWGLAVVEVPLVIFLLI